MIDNIVNSGLQPAVKAREASTATVSVGKSDIPPEQLEVAVEQGELRSAVSKLNDYVQNVQRTLSFSVEETTGLTIVQVFDSETEELIRQIPAEETIKLAASIEVNKASLLIQEQA
jgi:flagellar protein FlaG